MEEPIWFPEVGLGVRLWDGRYEDMDATWLRSVDGKGNLIPTGKELAEPERQRADSEQERADRLAEQLRQCGIEMQVFVQCKMLPKCLISLCAALLVGLALLRAQYPGVVIEVSPGMICSFAEEHTETIIRGWPAFWLEDRADIGFTHIKAAYGSYSIHSYSIVYGKLAVSAAAWAMIVVAAARLFWRAVSARRQFSLRSLFSLTFTVALLLTWWKVECAYGRSAKHPEWIPTPIALAGTPMLRMLGFPVSIGIPLLVGVGCSILWATGMVSSTVKRTMLLIGGARSKAAALEGQ